VYNNTLATVKHQIQQAENPTPAVVISVEAAIVDNAIRLDYLASELAHVKPEMESTEPNIPIDNSCTDDELYCGMAGGRGDYNDVGDVNNNLNAIHTASLRRRPATELERFDL
jgi:hypothetical protein